MGGMMLIDILWGGKLYLFIDRAFRTFVCAAPAACHTGSLGRKIADKC